MGIQFLMFYNSHRIRDLKCDASDVRQMLQIKINSLVCGNGVSMRFLVGVATSIYKTCGRPAIFFVEKQHKTKILKN